MMTKPSEDIIHLFWGNLLEVCDAISRWQVPPEEMTANAGYLPEIIMDSRLSNQSHMCSSSEI